MVPDALFVICADCRSFGPKLLIAGVLDCVVFLGSATCFCILRVSHWTRHVKTVLDVKQNSDVKQMDVTSFPVVRDNP